MENKNSMPEECPECLEMVEMSELNCFGGLCETCFEELNSPGSLEEE